MNTTTSQPPWRRKELCVDISVSKEGNKKTEPGNYSYCRERKIDKSRNNLDLHIYRNASKTPDGRTSALFCIPEFDFKCGVRLTDNITIFAAELTAIKLALLWISENSDRISCSRNMGLSLYSDSLSAVQAIKNEQTDCRPNMLNEIYEHVKSITNKITLTWMMVPKSRRY